MVRVTMRKAAVLMACVLVGASACAGPDEAQVDNDGVVEQYGSDEAAATRSLRFAPLGLEAPQGVGQAETRRTFKTAQSFQSYFGRAATGVDFSQQWVVFYSAGQKPTGGYTAAIDSIVLSGATVKVTTSLTSPGSGCVVPQSVSRPSILVVVEKPSASSSSTSYVQKTVTSSCSSGGGTTGGGSTAAGLPLLGKGTHSLQNVDFAEISSPSDGLRTPRDLAFNPNGGELWVVNRADDSTVTYFNVGTSRQRAEKRIDAAADHFMEEVSSIAFGKPMQFATCQESRNTYNRQAPPNDFMGPVLWSADMSIYAVANPQGLGSHLDMLHESPNCMGIAWAHDNVYWVFDGHDGSLVRYDFRRDHGPGNDDHSDGIIERFVVGGVKRVADIPSDLEFDRTSQLLYVADTGNKRIAVLDARSASRVKALPIKEAGNQHYLMGGAQLTTLVAQTGGDFVQPSGLALRNGVLYVADAGLGRITAFDLQGKRLDWLDLGRAGGSLMGMDFDSQGRLYVVDATGNRVLRIAQK